MFAASKTASVSGGYQISRSLRFNSADSAYLNRTPASAGNRKTWTWSAWVKRSGISTATNAMFGGGTSTTDFAEVYFGADDTLRFYDFAGSTSVYSSSVYRDVSAWYHLVYAIDTTQATASNRVKMYVNGVQVTSFGTANYPTQNADLYINRANIHSLGALNYTGGIADYFNGYITEVNFIDGQALTPSSFGETNAQTGVWQPKAYSGTYGTNGFYLNFSDNSNTTAATLGKDYSGNGNNWTPNNFSVTAGAGNDSLVDSPTSYGTDTGVGGTVRGNYSTLNPLFNATTLTNGNLDTSLSSASVTGTFGSSTGKWYFECTITAASGNAYLGIADQTLFKSDSSFSYSQTYIYQSNGYKGGNGGSDIYGSSYTTGDVIGVAYDLDAGSITFYKNGTSQGVAYSTGFTAGYIWRPFLYFGSGSATFNFGQRPFAYTAPSGYKALCTQNLPTPTIGATTATQAGKYFNTILYTGTGTTQSVTGVGFQPDFVWLKDRTTAYDNALFDSVRGASGGYYYKLRSNRTDSETALAQGQYGAVKTIDSDGYTLGSSDTVFGQSNASGDNYVAWNWKANGSGSTNTSGSITSTVSANTTSGFSVATFTTPASGAFTFGHGLGVAPSMVIAKSRSGTLNWVVYHSAIGPTQYLVLNATSSATTLSSVWNDTAPTSTVVSSTAAGFGASNNYVAYCFAEVAGYSKFGSYVGNGSSDGPFVYCGFRPAYVMIKSSTVGGSAWVVFDNKRNTFNVVDKYLLPNASDAEASFTGIVLDFTSNGFKIRGSQATVNNVSDTYIFMALAENPFKYSLAR